MDVAVPGHQAGEEGDLVQVRLGGREEDALVAGLEEGVDGVADPLLADKPPVLRAIKSR